jgi:hypothetical protein
MPMVPKLHTIESLAIELGRDRRTVARALRSVAPDGTLKGKPVWRLQTALRVLDRRSGGGGGGGDAAVIAELEEVAEELVRGLDDAGKIGDLEQRRDLLRKIGPRVGELDKLLEAQDNGDITRELLHFKAISDAVNQFRDLWRGAA